jgi:hypothetical protein
MSKRQITIQLATNAVFVVSEFIIVPVDFGSKLFIILCIVSVILNVLSLIVLIITMCEIADLQLQWESIQKNALDE